MKRSGIFSQKNTCYAGGGQKLVVIKTFPRSNTIGLFKSIAQSQGGKEMANIRDSLSHTKWLCKYYIVFTPKYRRKAIYEQYRESIVNGKSSLMIFDKHANLKYKFGNRHFWVEGYYVSTVGLNEATIKKYIQEQEAHDIAMDKVSEKEYQDPFKDRVAGRTNGP